MPCNAGMWSCSPTTGERPPPCSNFTFTTIDDRRAVLFGGYNGEQGSMNDVYIIDLHTMVMTVSLYQTSLSKCTFFLFLQLQILNMRQ